ncbi:hypothetical protein ACQSSU_03105 [Micromonospora echinospora]
MTEQERAEWEERLSAAVAETIRRRQKRRAERDHLAQARAHGLRQRHASKTTRNQQTGGTACPARP